MNKNKKLRIDNSNYKAKFSYLFNSIGKEDYFFLSQIFIAFLFLLVLSRHGVFLDELDNMLGASAIRRGGVIYKDFYSQHTPGVYYFMAIFAFLGCKSYLGFRLCAAVSIFLVWLFSYFRYKDIVGKFTISIWSLAYIAIVPTSWGHMVLSDTFEGFAFVVLIMEILKYYNDGKKLTVHNCIVFSFCFYFTFWVAFLAVFAFVFFLLVPATEEIKRYFAKDEKRNNKLLFLHHLKCTAIILIPLIAFSLYFLLNGAFQDAVFGMFTFNRDYYGKYASTASAPIIKTFFDNISNYGISVSGLLSSKNPDLTQMTLLIMHFCIILGLFDIYKKFKISILQMVLFIYAMMATGIRGFGITFHSIPFDCVATFFLGYVIQNSINIENKNFVRKNAVCGLLVVYSILSLNTFFSSAYASAGTIFKGIDNTTDPELKRIVLAVTDEDDSIWMSSIGNPYVYLSTNRKPGTRLYSTAPWMSEAFEKYIVEDLKNNKPKFIFFNPAHHVWGHKYGVFDKDAYEYIKENYTALPYSTEMYVPNEYYEEAVLKIYGSTDVLREPFMSEGDLSKRNGNVGEITTGTTIRKNIAATEDGLGLIKIRVGTYKRENTSNLKLTLLDENDSVVAQTLLFTGDMQNLGAVEFKFPPIYDSKGRTFSLDIASEDNKDIGNGVTFYGESKDKKHSQTTLNGKAIDVNLCVVTSYYE